MTTCSTVKMPISATAEPKRWPVLTNSAASSNWLCVRAPSRNIISPRLSWRSLLVAKTSWPPSKKRVALDAPEDKLELASEASGINLVEQGEELVVRFDFAGVERKGAAFEPARRRGNGFETRFFGK